MSKYVDVDKLDIITFQGKSEDFIDGAMAILEMIDELPEESVAPVIHAEWIWIKDEEGTKDEHLCAPRHKCSNCGEIGYKRIMRYCFHCGARMR